MIKRQLQAVVNRWLFRENVIITYGKKAKAPAAFAKAYPEAVVQVLHQQNFEDFLLG